MDNDGQDQHISMSDCSGPKTFVIHEKVAADKSRRTDGSIEFAETLREHSVLELTNSKIVSKVLRMSSEDRKYVRQYGSLIEFLRCSDMFDINGDMISLSKTPRNIISSPSENQETVSEDAFSSSSACTNAAGRIALPPRAWQDVVEAIQEELSNDWVDLNHSYMPSSEPVENEETLGDTRSSLSMSDVRDSEGITPVNEVIGDIPIQQNIGVVRGDWKNIRSCQNQGAANRNGDGQTKMQQTNSVLGGADGTSFQDAHNDDHFADVESRKKEYTVIRGYYSDSESSQCDASVSRSVSAKRLLLQPLSHDECSKEQLFQRATQAEPDSTWRILCDMTCVLQHAVLVLEHMLGDAAYQDLHDISSRLHHSRDFHPQSEVSTELNRLFTAMRYHLNLVRFTSSQNLKTARQRLSAGDDITSLIAPKTRHLLQQHDLYTQASKAISSGAEYSSPTPDSHVLDETEQDGTIDSCEKSYLDENNRNEETKSIHLEFNSVYPTRSDDIDRYHPESASDSLRLPKVNAVLDNGQRIQGVADVSVARGKHGAVLQDRLENLGSSASDNGSETQTYDGSNKQICVVEGMLKEWGLFFNKVLERFDQLEDRLAEYQRHLVVSQASSPAPVIGVVKDVESTGNCVSCQPLAETSFSVPSEGVSDSDNTEVCNETVYEGPALDNSLASVLGEVKNVESDGIGSIPRQSLAETSSNVPSDEVSDNTNTQAYNQTLYQGHLLDSSPIPVIGEVNDFESMGIGGIPCHPLAQTFSGVASDVVRDSANSQTYNGTLYPGDSSQNSLTPVVLTVKNFGSMEIGGFPCQSVAETSSSVFSNVVNDCADIQTCNKAVYQRHFEPLRDNSFESVEEVDDVAPKNAKICEVPCKLLPDTSCTVSTIVSDRSNLDSFNQAVSKNEEADEQDLSRDCQMKSSTLGKDSQKIEQSHCLRQIVTDNYEITGTAGQTPPKNHGILSNKRCGTIVQKDQHVLTLPTVVLLENRTDLKQGSDYGEGSFESLECNVEPVLLDERMEAFSGASNVVRLQESNTSLNNSDESDFGASNDLSPVDAKCSTCPTLDDVKVTTSFVSADEKGPTTSSSEEDINSTSFTTTEEKGSTTFILAEDIHSTSSATTVEKGFTTSISAEDINSTSSATTVEKGSTTSFLVDNINSTSFATTEEKGSTTSISAEDINSTSFDSNEEKGSTTSILAEDINSRGLISAERKGSTIDILAEDRNSTSFATTEEKGSTTSILAEDINSTSFDTNEEKGSTTSFLAEDINSTSPISAEGKGSTTSFLAEDINSRGLLSAEEKGSTTSFLTEDINSTSPTFAEGKGSTTSFLAEDINSRGLISAEEEGSTTSFLTEDINSTSPTFAERKGSTTSFSAEDINSRGLISAEEKGSTTSFLTEDINSTSPISAEGKSSTTSFLAEDINSRGLISAEEKGSTTSFLTEDINSTSPTFAERKGSTTSFSAEDINSRGLISAEEKGSTTSFLTGDINSTSPTFAERKGSTTSFSAEDINSRGLISAEGKGSINSTSSGVTRSTSRVCSETRSKWPDPNTLKNWVKEKILKVRPYLMSNPEQLNALVAQQADLLMKYKLEQVARKSRAACTNKSSFQPIPASSSFDKTTTSPVKNIDTLNPPCFIQEMSKLQGIDHATPPPSRIDQTTSPLSRIDHSTPPISHIDHATLPPSRIDHATLSPSHIDQATLPPSRIDQAILPPSRIDQATRPLSHIDHATLPPFRIDQATLPPSRIDHATLPPSRIDHATPPPSRIDHATPPPSRIDQATLPPSRIDHATLPPSRIDQATLPPSRIDQATLPPSRIDHGPPPLSRIDHSTPPPSRIDRATPPLPYLPLVSTTSPTSTNSLPSHNYAPWNTFQKNHNEIKKFASNQNSDQNSCLPNSFFGLPNIPYTLFNSLHHPPPLPPNFSMFMPFWHQSNLPMPDLSIPPVTMDTVSKPFTPLPNQLPEFAQQMFPMNLHPSNNVAPPPGLTSLSNFNPMFSYNSPYRTSSAAASTSSTTFLSSMSATNQPRTLTPVRPSSKNFDTATSYSTFDSIITTQSLFPCAIENSASTTTDKVEKSIALSITDDSKEIQNGNELIKEDCTRRKKSTKRDRSMQPIHTTPAADLAKGDSHPKDKAIDTRESELSRLAGKNKENECYHESKTPCSSEFQQKYCQPVLTQPQNPECSLHSTITTSMPDGFAEISPGNDSLLNISDEHRAVGDSVDFMSDDSEPWQQVISRKKPKYIPDTDSKSKNKKEKMEKGSRRRPTEQTYYSARLRHMTSTDAKKISAPVTKSLTAASCSMSSAMTQRMIPSLMRISPMSPCWTSLTNKPNNHSAKYPPERASNYERLIAALMSSHENLTRSQVIELVSRIQDKRGGSLSGMSFSMILAETNSLIKNDPTRYGSQKKDQPSTYKGPMWDDECPICFGLLSSPDLPVKSLDCGHTFHTSCIETWVHNHDRSCPLCRRLILFHDEFPALRR